MALCTGAPLREKWHCGRVLPRSIAASGSGSTRRRFSAPQRPSRVPRVVFTSSYSYEGPSYLLSSYLGWSLSSARAAGRGAQVAQLDALVADGAVAVGGRQPRQRA